jgi:hypothetical protein
MFYLKLNKRALLKIQATAKKTIIYIAEGIFSWSNKKTQQPISLLLKKSNQYTELRKGYSIT